MSVHSPLHSVPLKKPCDEGKHSSMKNYSVCCKCRYGHEMSLHGKFLFILFNSASQGGCRLQGLTAILKHKTIPRWIPLGPVLTLPECTVDFACQKSSIKMAENYTECSRKELGWVFSPLSYICFAYLQLNLHSSAKNYVETKDLQGK